MERILDDARYWIARIRNSGLPVNPVDVFTIVMGKTVEYYTRAIAERKGGGGEGFLRELLEEMSLAAQEMGKTLAATATLPAHQLPLF